MSLSLILALRGYRSKTTGTGYHSRQNRYYLPRIDISSREVLNHYTPEYQQLSAVAT